MVPQEIYNKENEIAKAEAVKRTAKKFTCRDNYVNAVLRGSETPKKGKEMIAYFLKEFHSVNKILSKVLTA